MKAVVVTGATGFIGGALVKRLLVENIKVYAIDINEEHLNELKKYGDVITIKASFEEYGNVDDFIQDDIDVFYHFAWQGVFGKAFEDYSLQLSNAKYAADAISLAIRLRCKKFVLAGTKNEFEVAEYLFDSDSSLRYTCIYAMSKLASEMICKTIAANNDITYSAGLIAMAYGENNTSKMLPNVLIQTLLNNDSPKLIEGNCLYDMIYIDDIVEAFLCIGKEGKNMTSYYIGHRNPRVFKEIVQDIRDIINPNIELKFGEYPEELGIDYEKLDLDALYNDTGFECKTNFKKSIVKTAEWVKSLNW